jgi:RNA recognition motif-containing protein
VKKLFVGNLPYAATEQDLHALFSEKGITPETVTVMRDRFTGQPRGFAFVEISDDGMAQRAIDTCHGIEMLGRPLVVNEARPITRESSGRGRPPAR